MTAIIPAAGLGTRFLPVTRVIPKEMLPIGAKPALELIVEEAQEAGADETVIVISRGKELIREYFSGRQGVRFAYQHEQKGLGDAVLAGLDAAAGCCADGEDNILILLGDALISGSSAAKEMVDVSKENAGAGVIGCEHVPREKISRYGILSVENGRITDLVEKPSPEEAPSDLAIAGRYLLPPAIAGLLRTQTPGKGSEIQLTDAIRRLVRPSSPDTTPFPILPYIYPGKRQDIGNPRGYFQALKEMGANS